MQIKLYIKGRASIKLIIKDVAMYTNAGECKQEEKKKKIDVRQIYRWPREMLTVKFKSIHIR